MMEKGVTKAVGDAVTATEMRPITRVKPPYTGRKPLKIDMGNVYSDATSEVGSYSIQQLASDPRTGTEIIADTANREATKRLYEQTEIQRHRAQER